MDLLNFGFSLLGRARPDGEPKDQFDLSPMSPAAGVSVPTSTTAWTALTSVKVPDGHRGWIRAYGVQVPDAALATLRLHIRVDGAMVKNFPDGITALVAGLRADELEEVWIPVKGGKLIELIAGQASGGALTCRGRIKVLVAEA